MDASDFITFAGRTVNLGKAGARSAISRAYYGAFHIACDILLELNARVPRGGKSHNLVPQYIHSANHALGTLAAKMLLDLHTERIRADYDMSSESVERPELARLRVESALEVQRLLEQFRQDCRADPGLRQQLHDGVAKVKAVHKA